MLVLLTLFCLNNVITQHGQNYYTQTDGIVSGQVLQYLGLSLRIT